MKSKIILGLLAVALMSSGCVGTRFTHVQNEQAGLGTNTLANIRKELGKPYMQSTLLKNGKTVKALSYSFAKVSLGIYAGKPVPARSQTFYFFDNMLVGQNYMSTEKADTTTFDSSVVEKIKENETNIKEVEALLGTPTGEYIYPMAEKEDWKANVYSYIQVKTLILKMNVYQQILTVSYDPATGIVKKVEFVETGEK